MKKLKFDKNIVDLILRKEYFKTWRLEDEKNLSVGDVIELINSETGATFAKAKINQVAIKYLRDINDQDNVGYRSFSDIDEIINVFNGYYSKPVTPESIIKIISFELIDNKSRDDNKLLNLENAKLFTDGGSRGNPGPSASGFVVYDLDDNVIVEGGEYLGITTNNQAEYQAVRHGLMKCRELQSRSVRVFMDSLLVANQLNGIYKIKNRELWPIHEDIKNISQYFDKVSYTHVPREMNKAADAVVNRILDESQSTF